MATSLTLIKSAWSLLDQRSRSLLAIGIILIATALAYAEGMSGPFMFDDFPNIVHNSEVHIASLGWEQLAQVWKSGFSSSIGRPAAMLSFGVNHVFTGLHPGAFKAVNLALHLVNGILIFAFVRILTSIALPNATPTPSLWVMAAWLLHPINVTPVLLVVQRMTELAALFSFSAILVYLRFRLNPARSLAGKILLGACVFVLWLLGVLAKETALLLPVFIIITEYYVLYPFRAARYPSPVVIRWCTAALVTTALAAICIMYFKVGLFSPQSYASRDFSLVDRMMTEARVVWLYVKLLAFPILSDFGLYHDGFRISRGLLDPASTIFALIAWGGVFGLLVIYGRRFPLVGFGVAWFIGGHLLESTVLPLELVFEHRNYFSSLGLLLAFADIAWRIFRAQSLLKNRAFILVASTIPLAILATQTSMRSYAYGDVYRFAEFEAANHPESGRALFDLAAARGRKFADRMERESEYRRSIQDLLTQAALADRKSKVPLLAKLEVACQFRDPIDPEWASELAWRWANTPYQAWNIPAMMQFTDRAINRALCLSEADVQHQYEAYLSNSSLPVHDRAMVLALFAKAMYSLNKDQGTAERRFDQALALTRTRAVLLRYIEFLFEVGRPDEAKKLLRSIPPAQRFY